MKRKTAKPDRSPEEIEKLVEDNMRLAYFYVNKYEHVNRDESERLSFAMKGLLEAAENWVEGIGVPFGAYAAMRIHWQYMRINTAARRFRRGFGINFLPLDFDFDGKTIHELIEDESAADPSKATATIEHIEKISEMLKSLKERERVVLEKRFGIGCDPLRLNEVGRVLGLTSERVRQIEKQAISRLKCAYEGRPFMWDSRKNSERSGKRAESAYNSFQKKVTKQTLAARKKAR